MAEHLRIEEAESEPSVLDIGAGSGVYSIPFALRSPKVRITAVDLPEVLKVTQRIAERYGIGDRLKTVAGDMAEVNFGVVDPADRSLTLTSFMAFPLCSDCADLILFVGFL